VLLDLQHPNLQLLMTLLKRLSFMLLVLGTSTFAQVSPDCSTAIPICSNTPINAGTDGYAIDDFSGASSTGCLETTPSGFIESNSAWYHFRTGAAGQFGFNIGHDMNEDWDFALYQATDCNNLGEPVRCNFFDNRDRSSFTGVGEDPSGLSNSVQYDDWLQVEPGQDYYLLINNFSNVNSGFSIQFSGNIFVEFPTTALDCSIIDNLLGPPLAVCANETVVLDATIDTAISYTWFQDIDGGGFNQITTANDATLQVFVSGTYRVQVEIAGDIIVSDVQVEFSEAPVPQPIDDITYCHGENGGVFDLGALDATILGGLSDQEFAVSYHSTFRDANSGLNPLSKQYVKSPGPETVYIRLASITNPNCFDPFSNFELNALEEPFLDFETEIVICQEEGVVTIGELAPNQNYQYSWSTGETTPTIDVTQSGSYTLTVTNSLPGISCISTSTVTVTDSQGPLVAAIEIDDLSRNNTVTIITENEGNFEYRVDDGPFQTSNVFEEVFPGTHTLTVRDVDGCGTFRDDFVVVGFLNHFSPNGDVLNETWTIQNLSVLEDPILSIYDRYGKLIIQLDELSSGWDGTFNGQPLPSTDYWFRLTYVNDDGMRVEDRYLQKHFTLRR